MLPRESHLSSLTPVFRPNGNCVSTWTDFEFRGDQRSNCYDACSPKFCTSPLLPRRNYHLSPKSRLQAITDGRKELMEMIQDMPESSYELSLKDIVDEQQQQEEGEQKDIPIDERSLRYRPAVNIKQKKKIMARSESMDSGVFLLKMFFPTSLGMKGKSTAGNHRSNVSRKSSLEGSDKTGHSKWHIVRFLSMGEGKKSGSISRHSSSSDSSRENDCNFTPGCWSFHKKCRSSQQRGFRL